MVFYAIWVQIKKCGKIRTAIVLLLVLNFVSVLSFTLFQTMRQHCDNFETSFGPQHHRAMPMHSERQKKTER